MASIGAAGGFPVGVLAGVELGGWSSPWEVMPVSRTEAAVSFGALSCLFGVFSLWRSLPGQAVAHTVLSKRLGRRMDRRPNKSLQRTFDPPPTFAAAKAGVASNAAELWRWASFREPREAYPETQPMQADINTLAAD